MEESPSGMAHAWKACVRKDSRVRISPPPPMSKMTESVIKQVSELLTHMGQRVIELKSLELSEKLNDGIEKLNTSIENANKQNSLLEKSNQKLQYVMLGLTLVTTFIAIFEASDVAVKAVGMSGTSSFVSSILLATGLTYLVSWFISNEINKP